GNDIVLKAEGGDVIVNTNLIAGIGNVALTSTTGAVTENSNGSVQGNGLTVAAFTNVTLNGTTMVTNLTAVTTNGSISGAGIVSVASLATLLATNGSIILNNGLNDFNVLRLVAQNATLADAN